MVEVADGDGVNEHGSENEANLFGQSVPRWRRGGVVLEPEAQMRLALGPRASAERDDYLGP